MTTELSGGVESDWSGLEDFSMQGISVCHMADVVRKGGTLRAMVEVADRWRFGFGGFRSLGFAYGFRI